MTNQDRDRADAFHFALALAIAAAIFGLLAGTAGAQTDGSAEPMRLGWTGGSLPSLSGDGAAGGDGGRGTDAIQVRPTGDWRRLHTAASVAGAPPEFRHLAHLGGPQGCVFTATPLHALDGTLLHSGGGRDCPLSETDRRCGYIATGFDVFALAGASCEQYGIESCTGPFCY